MIAGNALGGFDFIRGQANGGLRQRIGGSLAQHTAANFQGQRRYSPGLDVYLQIDTVVAEKIDHVDPLIGVGQ